MRTLWISLSFPEDICYGTPEGLWSSHKLHLHQFVAPFDCQKRRRGIGVCVTKALGSSKHPIPANKPIPSCLWHNAVPSSPFHKDRVGKHRAVPAETVTCQERVVLVVLNMKDPNNCKWEQRGLYMLFLALLLFWFFLHRRAKPGFECLCYKY